MNYFLTFFNKLFFPSIWQRGSAAARSGNSLALSVRRGYYAARAADREICSNYNLTLDTSFASAQRFSNWDITEEAEARVRFSAHKSFSTSIFTFLIRGRFDTTHSSLLFLHREEILTRPLAAITNEILMTYLKLEAPRL